MSTPLWQLKSYDVEYIPGNDEGTIITRVMKVRLSNGLTEKLVVDSYTGSVPDWPATAVPQLVIDTVVAAANA